MPSIGERLRHQRLDRGVDLGTVARETKISQKLLEAIEAEEFDKLPGGVFRKSFVRQYAHALGVEESEIADELDRIAPSEDVLPLPGTVPERLESDIPALPTVSSVRDRRWMVASMGSFAGVLAVMLACAGVYSWWQKIQTAPQAAAVRQAAPEQSKVSQPAQTGAPTGPVTPNAGQAAAASPAAMTQAPAQPGAAQSVPAVQAATAPPADQGAAPPNPAGAQAAPPPAQPAPMAPAPYAPPAEGRFRVDLVASEPVWVAAMVDGKAVFSGTLEPAQGRTLEASSNVRLRVGNAGGLGVNLNGKPIGGIGPRGQIRVVELTPGGSQVLLPPPVKPENDPNAPVPAPAKPEPRVSSIQD
jgi:cytoskeleton protein RodZ